MADRHAHLVQILRTELLLKQKRSALKKQLTQVDEKLRDVRKQLRDF